MTLKKNWMIRTKDFYLLGPVSKKKILELLNSNSLRQSDEICSGNGFWFSVSEKNLLDKYVIGDEAQSFNPTSEAKIIFSYLNDEKEQEEGSLIPKDKDLEYPSDEDMDSVKKNILKEIKKGKNTEDTPLPIDDEVPPLPEEIVSEDLTIVKPQTEDKKK